MDFPLPFSLRYIIRGDEEEWDEVLSKAGQNASIVSVKRLMKLKYSPEASLVFPDDSITMFSKSEAEELNADKMKFTSLIASQFS